MNIEMFMANVVKIDPSNRSSIQVSLTSLTPFATGELTPGQQSIQIETINPLNNVSEKKTVTTVNTITAEFVGGRRNAEPPHVQKGEVVIVYSIGSAGTYHWEDLGRHQNLRYTDRWSVLVSAKPKTDTSKSKLSSANAYRFSVDSENKNVTLSTSGINGEAATYEFVLDTDKGQARLSDNHGNKFSINSKEHTLSLTNAEGSAVVVAKSNVILKGTDQVLIQGGKQIVFETGLLKFLGGGGPGATVLETKGITIKSGLFVVEAGRIGLNGQVTTGGSLIVGGPVLAAGYSVGAGPGGYSSVTVNHQTMSGGVPGGAANGITPDSAARHCTAQEDFLEYTGILQTALEKIALAAGADVSAEVSAMLAKADSSLMPQNTGT